MVIGQRSAKQSRKRHKAQFSLKRNENPFVRVGFIGQTGKKNITLIRRVWGETRERSLAPWPETSGRILNLYATPRKKKRGTAERKFQ